MADAAAALRALAKHYGVQRAWRAWDGSRRVVDDDTIVAVLASMGVGIERLADAPEALRATRATQLRTLMDPVVVLWDGAPLRIQLRLPATSATTDFVVRVREEDGTTHEHTRRRCRLGAPRRDGPTHVMATVEPPARLGLGVHELRVELATGTSATAIVIAAPSQLRERPPSEQRRWGVFVPLYALHDDTRAAGDLGALDEVAQWAARHSADAIGTLPLLATFVGAGQEPTTLSPYSPVSRRFWNESYVDARAVPELRGAVSAEPRDDSRVVDLAAIARRRRAVLSAGLDALDDHPARRRALDDWLRGRPDVRDYGRFRAAVERDGPGADASRIGDDDPTARYHAYVQWLAREQLDELARRLGERRQVLYLDLPLGTHPDGFDVYSRPDLYVRGARVGAPPDEFNTAGQDWGAPPVNPHASRADGHAELRDALREHLSVAGMLRVDHVMGLHRLWWLPPGAGAADGAYVQYPAEELYALLCLEADRAGAMVVGENLGTVPHETNRALQAHRMLGTYLVPFELRDAELPPPGRRTLAGLDTHDTPTFAAWWDGLAPTRRRTLVDALRAAGVVEDDEALDPSDDAAAVLGPVLRHLGSSRAEMILVALEDLWLEREQQNDPSTPSERNFALRAARRLDELDDEALHTLLAGLDAARRRGLVGV